MRERSASASSVVLGRMAEVMAQRDRESADAVLVTVLGELLGARSVALYRAVGPVDDGQRWVTRSSWCPGSPALPFEPGAAEARAWPALDERPVALAALRSREAAQQPGDPWRLALPLASVHDLDSVFEIELDAAASPGQQALIDAVLAVYAQFVRLLGDNERDTLTGLLNRRTYDEAFYRLAARTLAGLDDEPDAEPGSERRLPEAPQRHYLGVVDIDHFKRVNDRHGHLIGDEVLLLMSRLMRGCFRLDDRLYRFGGEEFVVLMRCSSHAAARAALERLRRAVGSHPFPHVGQITVSVGFTRVEAGDSPSTAFERADKAVYWAKTHGRNQVCGHAELVALGHLPAEARTGAVELF